MSNLTPKEARELWAQALESGKYEQGRARLTVVEEWEGVAYHCCLGVACVLAVEHGVVDHYHGGDAGLGAYPEIRAWLGLRGSLGDLDEGGSLAGMNDGGRTFSEIAATIRAEPEGLVVA